MKPATSAAIPAPAEMATVPAAPVAKGALGLVLEPGPEVALGLLVVKVPLAGGGMIPVLAVTVTIGAVVLTVVVSVAALVVTGAAVELETAAEDLTEDVIVN